MRALLATLGLAAAAWPVSAEGPPGAPAAGGRGVQALPAPPGVAQRLYQPEFRAAPVLLEALQRFGLEGTEAVLVAPWVTEQRGDQRVPVPTRLVLRGPPEQVDRLEAALRRLDSPRPAVVVSVLVAETRCVANREIGGHVSFLRSDALNSSEAIYRGTASSFEPDAWLRSTLAGVRPFEGTSITFGRVRSLDGAYEHVLRALSKRSQAETLAQPTLVCTEGESCSLASLTGVPSVTWSKSVTGPVIAAAPVQEAGLRLTVRPDRIGADGVVLDLTVDLRFADDNTEPDAPVGAVVLRTRTLTTRVTARDGETMVLGGLTLTRRRGDRRSLPCVGDLPVVGLLGSARAGEVERTEVLFVLTPRVLSP